MSIQDRQNKQTNKQSEPCLAGRWIFFFPFTGPDDYCDMFDHLTADGSSQL